ncbi:ATP synthase F0 subunit A [Mangrovimonas yunxiaonensis]|uniref:ATP synthase subunit a n=1 Tax=Mangrovimonas yunxiaonensis TaxID=1197477 RepID=A0A084TKH7_9FLAO|nr:F0F1 ATP synthase subunit A [Mangrovimonas yunxiaonensis]KFB01213.1 ATP synthase F0 subunit A [Mangrovimonas yunxiaonensis]MBR9758289.1 F0F1 ATP synthase subunit A [Algicola sp.]GGH38014.1 ATP synthase subunit a [Mangrovimonas yunxiaonensis]
MQNIFSLKTICLLFVFVTTFSFAKETKAEAGENDIKTEIKEYIDHHLLDSYDFSLFSYTKDNGEHVYVGFPLPVILWDDGLKVFSSSKLKHGETVAEVGGNYYKSYHGKIYKTDAEGTITYDEAHHPTNVKPLDFSITKNVFTILIVGLLMFLMFGSMAKSYKNGALPKGMGRFLEPIVLYIRDDIAIPNIGKKHYKRYMSFLLTIFFFIWIVNLLGLTPLGVNVTNNIAVTLALALLTFLITNFTANKSYWGHIFWMPGVPKLMRIVLAPIELLGIFIKPFSLLIRLYANITAGHIVLMSIIGMMFIFKNWIGSSLSFGLAFALSLLELLVAALQAYIFTMLSALYFGQAVEEHDDH